MLRGARYILAGTVVFAALPSLAVAGEAMKDVFITNTPDDPVPVQGVGTQQISGDVQVSNLPAARSLRQGYGDAHRERAFRFPPDIVLTDLIITAYYTSEPSCQATLFEGNGIRSEPVQFFSLESGSTAQLHLESGLTRSPVWNEWGVETYGCGVRVLWSGYTAP